MQEAKIYFSLLLINLYRVYIFYVSTEITVEHYYKGMKI